MQSTTFTDSKRHYPILDGLRGVAAVVVVLFHILEIFSGGNHLKQFINHGYLAVDFFFLLSGYVIAHAYDDRWGRMSIGGFFKRRLIRLHPMIIIGMLLGSLLFYFGKAPDLFPQIGVTPLWKLIVVTVAALVLIPVPLSWDIRGWYEMYPLNGPAWSLFFEYIANILYAFVFRRLPVVVLGVLVLLAGVALVHLGTSSPTGDIIGGWALEPTQLKIGFTRLLFPFLAGLLLHRIFRPLQVRHAFIRSSLLLVACLAFPRVGGAEHLWINGLYDSLTIILLFPVIVLLGTSTSVGGKGLSGLCTFLGAISYPLYIVHFPFAYIFYAWAINNGIPLSKAWPAGVGVLAISMLVAYASMRFYDIPVRRWLTRKFMKGSASRAS